MKVLVFDPQPDSRDALRRAFAARGGTVRGFGSADDASRALFETSPDIIVADLSAAPEADALLRAALSASPRPRVYALVEADRLQDAVGAVERGADDFVWWPVSEERVAGLWTSAEEIRGREQDAEERR